MAYFGFMCVLLKAILERKNKGALFALYFGFCFFSIGLLFVLMFLVRFLFSFLIFCFCDFPTDLMFFVKS